MTIPRLCRVSAERWIQGERPLKVIDRFVQFALGRQRNAEVVVRTNKSRDQLERRAKMHDGFIDVTTPQKHDGEIVVSLAVLWVQLNRPAQMLDRFIALAA